MAAPRLWSQGVDASQETLVLLSHDKGCHLAGGSAQESEGPKLLPRNELRSSRNP